MNTHSVIHARIKIDTGGKLEHIDTITAKNPAASAHAYPDPDSSTSQSYSEHTHLPVGIGNTPSLKLSLSWVKQPKTLEVFAKCEQLNLGGSSKARPAHY